MEVFYILNGLGFSRGMPIGGADKRALEIGRRLQNRGVKVAFLTTDAGKEVLEKWGLRAKFFVVKRPFFWPRFLENNLLGRILAYFYVVLATPFLRPVAPLRCNSIVYPTSDQFFDLLPAVFLRFKLRPVGSLVGIVHHWVPSPFKRGGNFVVNSLLFLSQRAGFLILKRLADLVFIPKTDEGEKLKKILLGLGFAEDKLVYFLNGVNLEEIGRVPEQEKKYEACFLGGLRPSKGIFDLVPIWRRVVEKRPAAKLLIIGGGVEKYERKLKAQSSELKSGSIVLAGVLSQDKLFQTVKACKILILPSYEEGWGIVVGEALAAGLPVVAYDLPAYRPYGAAVEKIPVGDRRLFAEKVVELLAEERLRAEKVALGKRVIGNFGWEKAAEAECGTLSRLTVAPQRGNGLHL